MLLADIGNTRMHIYNGQEVIHLNHQEAMAQYGTEALKYISVNHQLRDSVQACSNWEDISSLIHLPNSYDTMGVDRKALCLSKERGVFVSAGSAITVDLVENGTYRGGFLLPGLRAYLGAYGAISPALESELNTNVSLKSLPRSTQDGISFGILGSIQALIDRHRAKMPLYISGGDGELLARFFNDAHFDERLIFEGMKNALKGVR